jgi:class 3 adenylate cyclase/dihydrofolate reductase
MGRLIVVEFITLDGVIEAPGFEEHREGRNAWALRLQSPELQRHNMDLYIEAGAVLLGRVTYQIWAAFWPTAGQDNAFSARMNQMPKYVASRTLTRLDWESARLLGPDLAAEVARLKAEIEGDIIVTGSADLVGDLLKLGLVDAFEFQVFPLILGSGKRLFPSGLDTRHFQLTSSRSYPRGVMLLRYEPATEEPSSNFVDEYGWTREQIRSFRAAMNTERVLATVLFTDIVDSTRHAAELGDRQWRQLLDRHDQLARREVERWRGRYIKSTGDGVLATFDAPTRALWCAASLRDAVADLGVSIRAALHTGEIESRDGDVGGIGVHIASRALAEAGPDQVVVTRTVRDLATGTDLRFEELGTVGLRGVPGQWELFSASLA